MPKIILLLAAALLPALAQAQAYKCRSASGQIVIADQPCQGGSRTEAVVQPETVTEAQRFQAQEAQAQRLRELEGLKAKRQAEEAQRDERLALESNSRQSGDAVRECVRDVERSNAPDSTQLDLIAACQSAGINQKQRQIDRNLVRECVRGVEQRSGTEADKARAMARCHGADVQTESPAPAPVYVRPIPRQRMPFPDCSNGRCPEVITPKPRVEPEGQFIGGKVQPCKQIGNSLSCK